MIRTVFRSLAIGLGAWAASGAQASDCNDISVGLTPISDLGNTLYLGQFAGGLYPAGNLMPAAHFQAGVIRANSIVPRLPNGQPSAAGKYILLSIGMSNTTQEFCGGTNGNCASYSFIGQASGDPTVNHSELVLIDGAAGGQTASTWDNPTDTNYNRIRDQILTPLGLAEPQVAAAWVKVANAQPSVSLPNAGADAFTLVGQMGNIARALRVRYPNIRVVFFSSRIYAGYADTPLNPEPYAYESGFAVKWVVQAQIDQMNGGGIDPLAGDLDFTGVAPWIAWGPYLWADGLNPRSDGLFWQCGDLSNDGTHPSQSGRQKVGTLLLDFFKSSSQSRPWFLHNGPVCPADLDHDGFVGQSDLAQLLSCYNSPSDCGDVNGDGDTTQADLAQLLADYDTACPA